MPEYTNKAMLRAVKKAGNISRLAKMMGVSRQAVQNMLKGKVPPERVLEIEKLTGVSRHDLRPDIYPREQTA